MRSWSAGLSAALAAPSVEAHLALWIEARDTATGAVRKLGWWSGSYPLELTIDDEVRQFDPIGDAIAHEELVAATDLQARRYRVSLIGQQADLSTATRDLDLEQAPVWLWRLVRDPADAGTWRSIGLLKGELDELEARSGAAGEPGGIDLYVASAAVALTWTLGDRRYNDATIQRRSPTTSAGGPDRFGRYASIAGEVRRPW